MAPSQMPHSLSFQVNQTRIKSMDNPRSVVADSGEIPITRPVAEDPSSGASLRNSTYTIENRKMDTRATSAIVTDLSN
jgi:hypothetical protein